MLHRIVPAACLLTAAICPSMCALATQPASVAPRSVAQQSDVDLVNAKTVLILGDSITHAGHYVVDLELALRQHGDGSCPTIINLGLPSETCCGLSEPGHPFPRPNVHERLERALEKIQPDIVLACYGMNDGIYHPFDEGRFAAYRDGVTKLVQLCRDAEAQIVLLTPPPFDPVAVMNKGGTLLPSGQSGYGWKGMADTYDQVIARYAAWIMSNEAKADLVIDIHSPIQQFLAERRRTVPTFTVSGDGIHMNDRGHRVAAKSILKEFQIDWPTLTNGQLRQQVRVRERLLHDAWLSEVGHKRPGMKPGLPIEQAKNEAAQLDTSIRQLVGEHTKTR